MEAGDTRATYVPRGEKIMNIKMKLRALRKAEFKVYNKPSGSAFEQFKRKISKGATSSQLIYVFST